MYRIKIDIKEAVTEKVRRVAGEGIRELAEPIFSDALSLLKERAVENLSGIPFDSPTGTHIIHKRTGKGAASVQVQYPYGSPWRGRVFASAIAQYPGNSPVNYLSVLEYGRGEVRAKYTPSARSGKVGYLTIPGGTHELVSGQNNFRGITGRYRFVRSLPPMEGKFWLKSAGDSVRGDIQKMAKAHCDRLLKKYGL